MGSPKLTIQECNEIARKKGGECLSTEYINTDSKLKWRCSSGHVWEQNLNHIKYRSDWCPYCSGRRKDISECQSIAQKQGGKCLSSIYKSTDTKLKWECIEGHQWVATLNNVKNNRSWCPTCAGKQKHTIESCQEIASSKNGTCLSQKYVGLFSKLRWECSERHQWLASFNNILSKKSWCPTCAGSTPRTLAEAHEVASIKGGRCLSTKIKNSKTPLLWECSKGHQWKTALAHILNQNSWCPKCNIELKKQKQLRLYGVEYPMHRHDVALRAAKRANNVTIKHHWKTGKEVVCVASYECRTVDILNSAQIDYEWQEHTFKLPNNKTYRPDLYLNELDLWVEIKGYMRPDAKQKWDWFSQNYPNSVLWDKQALKDMNVIPSRRSRCR